MVAMPMGGADQQQMEGIDGQAKHGKEQEQEKQGHTPTSTGGYRSNCTTPEWNAVHGGVVQVGARGRAMAWWERTAQKSGSPPVPGAAVRG